MYLASQTRHAMFILLTGGQKQTALQPKPNAPLALIIEVSFFEFEFTLYAPEFIAPRCRLNFSLVIN